MICQGLFIGRLNLSGIGGALMSYRKKAISDSTGCDVNTAYGKVIRP
jgi:hypothetical protein